MKSKGNYSHTGDKERDARENYYNSNHIKAQEIVIVELRQKYEKASHDAERYKRRVIQMTADALAYKAHIEKTNCLLSEMSERLKRLEEEISKLQGERL